MIYSLIIMIGGSGALVAALEKGVLKHNGVVSLIIYYHNLFMFLYITKTYQFYVVS